jgi:hypothetical protein
VSGVGVLTFRAPGSDAERLLDNVIAEIEGRLRFILTEEGLEPVFGSEPFDPAERAIGSPALARLHLQHVIGRLPPVLVILLAGDVDAAVVAALVRYLDARVSPPLSVFLLAADEGGFAAHASALRASGELAALGRPHDSAVAAIRREDPRFAGFLSRVAGARSDGAGVRREAVFRDDLRRHHHLSVCPGGASQRSWRLEPLQALARHGITGSIVDREDVRRRASWLLGRGGDILDPRLLELQAACPRLGPGDLRDHAVALAIRDVADERLANTIALGSRLPSEAPPASVADILRAMRDPAGRVAVPIPTACDDDDAGALSQLLLQRASVTGPTGKFVDPAQRRAGHAATTVRIVGFAEGAWLLAPLSGSASLPPVDGVAVTALRIAFHLEESVAFVLESRAPAVVRGDAVSLPLGGAIPRWPADRAALIPGAHAERLASLLPACGFRVIAPSGPGSPSRRRKAAP